MRNRLAEIRNKKGLTLKELGKKIGMRDNTLSQYETGKRKPSEKALIQISNLFKIPISYLVGNGWSQNDVTMFMLINLMIILSCRLGFGLLVGK